MRDSRVSGPCFAPQHFLHTQFPSPPTQDKAALLSYADARRAGERAVRRLDGFVDGSGALRTASTNEKTARFWKLQRFLHGSHP